MPLPAFLFVCLCVCIPFSVPLCLSLVYLCVHAHAQFERGKGQGDDRAATNSTVKAKVCPLWQGKQKDSALSGKANIMTLPSLERQTERLCPLYQERLQELEGQMAVKERELQRLKAELEAIDSDRARTEEEKKKMRAAFEEKVEAVQRHMVQLKKQLKEGEAAKVGSPGVQSGLYLLHVLLSTIKQ